MKNFVLQGRDRVIVILAYENHKFVSNLFDRKFLERLDVPFALTIISIPFTYFTVRWPIFLEWEAYTPLLYASHGM